MTKPPINPVRWQPPPSRPVPEPDLTATLHVVALPGTAPEDAAVFDAGPDVAVGIGDDVLGGGAGHRDHVQLRNEIGCG